MKMASLDNLEQINLEHCCLYPQWVLQPWKFSLLKTIHKIQTYTIRN